MVESWDSESRLQTREDGKYLASSHMLNITFTVSSLHSHSLAGLALHGSTHPPSPVQTEFRLVSRNQSRCNDRNSTFPAESSPFPTKNTISEREKPLSFALVLLSVNLS